MDLKLFLKEVIKYVYTYIENLYFIFKIYNTQMLKSSMYSLIVFFLLSNKRQSKILK